VTHNFRQATAEQLREELELIEGPRGQEYLTYAGSTESPADVALRIRDEIETVDFLIRTNRTIGD
jgi:hypothetical protein